MANSIFSPTFDWRAYVQKRALEIADLEERKLYKEVAERMFLELYHQNEQAMAQLEERVFSEVDQTDASGDFSIALGLTDQAHYDATDPYMHPIFPEDAVTQEVPAKEMLAALHEGRDYFLYHIYVEASYPLVQELCQADRQYYGVVKTPNGDYRASFRVARSTDVEEKLKALYQTFVNNDISWHTLCAAYLHKRLTVCISSIDGTEPIEEISEITIDFEAYNPFVRYHMIPLWNLETVEEKSSTYPIPCADSVNYEHRIYAHRLQADCAYLVANQTAEIHYVYRAKGDLVIVGPDSGPHGWQLLKFNRPTQDVAYPYPVLSNRRSESFSTRLAGTFHKQIRTRAGIAAVLEGLAYGEYLTYHGVELGDEPAQPTSYDMDDFLTAEIGAGAGRPTLRLLFQARDPENLLNGDVMSFLVTSVQALFPDYHCVGLLQ